TCPSRDRRRPGWTPCAAGYRRSCARRSTTSPPTGSSTGSRARGGARGWRGRVQRLWRRPRKSGRTASEVVDPDAAVGLADVLDSAAVVVIIIAGVAFLVFVAIPLVLVVVDLMVGLLF